MRIRFHKVSDERHVLELVRDGRHSERLECETRSLLLHDLLHYAVESAAGFEAGFWGQLAGGKSLAEMNARTGAPMNAEMAVIEQTVGVLHGAVKGRRAAEMVAGLRTYATATGIPVPSWLTVDFVTGVQERMRQLVGRWTATRFGVAMDLEWPDRASG